MITLNSPIAGDGGTVAEALASLDGPDAEDRAYVAELFRLCQEIGIDFRIAFAQFMHETANATSPRWRTNRNPAGLGIVHDDDPDPATFTGVEAARVHAWTLDYATSTQAGDRLGVLLPDSAQAFRHRWKAKYDDPKMPTVQKLSDLNIRYVDSHGERQATWAWDADYGPKLVAKANAIFTEAPMPDLNMTKGLIPMPPYIEAYVDVSNRITTDSCRGYDWLGPRADPPRGLVLHRPQSDPNTSNEDYLDGRCCPALFDFEILANGQAKRFAQLGDGVPTGWANGKVVSPYGDALKYLDHYGWDVNEANEHFESCEVGGWFLQPGEPSHEDPISEAQWAWLAQWIASRAHDYGIRWDTFPIISAENERSYVTWHQEWTIGTGKVCPGATLMNGTPALIQRAKAIMQAAQTGTQPTKPPTFAPSVLPAWWAEALAHPHPGDRTENGVRYRVLRRNFKCKVQTTRRSEPDTTSKVSGPKVAVDELIYGERLVTANGKDFVLSQDGHYILASKLSPKATLRAW
jgi:hypothetical protein